MPAVHGVRMCGITVHALSRQQVVEAILAELECGRGGSLLTLNLDQLRRCRKDVVYRALIDESDLVVADGMPLIWASRIRGLPLPERVPSSDLTLALAEAAQVSGRKVFLLGGKRGTVGRAAEMLRNRLAGLEVVGSYDPGHGFEFDTARLAHTVELLTKARPDFVLVAMESPIQEHLIHRLRRNLPGAWWIGAGDSFSFITGDVRRAPGWLQHAGLEWIHRLVQSPRQRARRYLGSGLLFAGWLFGSSLVRGLQHLIRHEPVSTDMPRGRWATGVDTRDKPFDLPARVASEAHMRAVESQVDREMLVSASPPAMGRLVAGSVAQGRASMQGKTLTHRSPGVGPVVHRSGSRQPQLEAVHDSPPEVMDPAEVLLKLRTMILLGGKVRPNNFTAGTSRPVLELPISVADTPQGPRGERLIDAWLSAAADVARLAKIEWLPTRLAVSDEADAPSQATPVNVVHRPTGAFTIARDVSEYRGTGGLLHDLARDYHDDDLLLVCTAQQLLIDPLAAIVRALTGRFARGADLAMVAHDDGTPGGVMLVRCGALRDVATIGYVDMKEQALPKIAQRFDVRAVRSRRPTGMPVRTANEYIRALQRYHGQASGRGRGSEPHPLGVPLAEDLNRHFCLVEPGAIVDPTAYIHDSVILAGARVEAGAMVVRSVVCQESAIKRDRQAVDQVVTGISAS